MIIKWRYYVTKKYTKSWLSWSKWVDDKGSIMNVLFSVSFEKKTKCLFWNSYHFMNMGNNNGKETLKMLELVSSSFVIGN